MPPQAERDRHEPDAPQDARGRETGAEHHGKKHRNKVRSAWISFIGRIVAQVAGAAATIVLGLSIITKYDKTKADAPKDDRPAAAPVARRAVDPAHDGIDLAVLPFENFSGDPAHEYLADGVTELLIGNLSRVEGLHVTSRTSSMHFKGVRRPLPEVAAALGGVDLIIEGSIARHGGRMRVTAQLINAATDQERWSRTYERLPDDVFALQTDVSAAIAQEVEATVMPDVERLLAGSPPVDAAASEQYLRGRRAAALGAPADVRAAIGYFQNAIRMNPSFAAAQAGLAHARVLFGLSLDSPLAAGQQFALAREAALRAIQLDPGAGEAHAALAAVFHQVDWNWSAGDQAYRRAIALRPSDAQTRDWYALFLAEQGRHREAQAQAELAVELDPLSAETRGTLAKVHYFAGRFDRAIAAGARAVELDPLSVAGRLTLAWSLLEQGDATGAIAVCDARPWPTGLDQMLATLVDANRRLGRVSRAEELRHELLGLGSASPSALLRVHVARGDLDAALQLLARAASQRLEFVRAARVDPFLTRLRGDPRFAAVVAQLGSGDGQ